MSRTRIARSSWLFLFMVLSLVTPSWAVETVLVGSALPADQGWSAFTLISNPDVSTNGTVISISTMGTEIPANFLLYYKNVGAGRGFAVEFRLRLLALEAPHDPFDAGLVFFGSYKEHFGTPSDRSQMIYFDIDSVGWGDDSQSAAVDTMGAFHLYRLEVDIDGAARFYVDGVQRLSRSNFLVEGAIAFGDQNNGPAPQNSWYLIQSVEMWRDCNQNGVGDEFDVSGGTSMDCNGDLRPDECDPDCNQNEESDLCDLGGGQSFDCNHNEVPDECEIDCNDNGVLDPCDINSGTSGDCDHEGTPDECQGPTDCNDNGSLDLCDLYNGTSEDCDGNGQPDECDTPIDCNGNGVEDLCDIRQGTALDCNFNIVPDSCDISSGFSQDDDLDEVPDECPFTPFVGVTRDPTTVKKSRFISFVILGTVPNHAALRVKLVTLHQVIPPYTNQPTIPFPAFEGKSVWVGPPLSYAESSSSQVQFWAAKTQCSPHYQDWSTLELLHVTGSPIVPSSVYEVEVVSGICEGDEDDCSAVSPPLVIRTSRWGDVWAPFHPPATSSQPDFTDCLALINKFRSNPGAPIKARALLAGTSIFGEISNSMLNNDYDFSHIVADVDAFRGSGYPYKMGKCAVALPPPATGACSTDAECGANGPCNLYCPN